MSDYVGALEIPVGIDATPIGDPMRSRLGGFLQAAIRAGCQTAWSAIGGGTDVVERVETNDPSDNTFVSTRLPALFVYRDSRNRKIEWISADYFRRTSNVIALWIPQTAIQDWRAKREPFWHAIEAAVMNAVSSGRTPGWRIDGDTDEYSATEGSLISAALGLQRPLHFAPVVFEEQELVIEIEKQPSRKYPALKMTFTISEDATSGALGDVYPTATDVTISNGDGEDMGEYEDP